MPVSFSSPPRNLFLLGSSGADVVTNFFAAVDGSEIDVGYDVFIPDEIRYGDEYANVGQYYTVGTSQNSNSKKIGWLHKQSYYPEYPTGANPPNPPANLHTHREFFIHTDTAASVDTTLRAMEIFGSSPNHELIVVGKTGQIPWIAKYIHGQAVQWVSTSNTANVEYTGVCKSGTNYYACGNTPDTGSNVTNNQARAFVEKFDSNGNPGWGKSATMLGRDVVLEKISANSRDEIIAVGYLEDDTADKGYIVKIDANTGEILWDRSLERNISGSGNSGGNGNDDIASADVRCTACYVDGNDQIYVVGSIDGRNPVDNGVGEFLVKYSPEGNILWQRENHTDHYTALDGAPNMIPFDVKSDTDTQQTVVLSVENQGSFASNNSDIFISKYSKDGTLVFRRKISKGSNTLGNASLDADPSFYYILFTDQQTVPISGTPDRYFFGKVSTSGNGLGNFQYDDGSTVDTTPIDYTIVSNENKIGRLSDGSVRNDISDFVTYPFTANKLVFDDLATPVSNKKKQMDGAGSFVYGGSPSIRPTDNAKKEFTTNSYPPQAQQNYIGLSEQLVPTAITGGAGTNVGQWTRQTTNTTITANAIANPLNVGSGAEYYNISATTGRRLEFSLDSGVLISGQRYTYSWWMKGIILEGVPSPEWQFQALHAGSNNSEVKIVDRDGNVLEDLGARQNYIPKDTEWHRVAWTFTAASSTASAIGGYNSNTLTGDLWYLWGAQLVDGNSAGKYVRTFAGPENANGDQYIPSVLTGSGTGGPAYEFDGTDELLQIGEVEGDFSSFTVEMWFRTDRLRNWDNPIDCNFDYASPSGAVNSGNIGPRYEINAGGGSAWVFGSLRTSNDPFLGASTGTISTNQWYHTVFTYDGNLNETTATAYLDGEQTGTANPNTGGTYGWVGEFKNLVLGKGFGLASGRFFDGRIGEVRLYERALSSAEVYQNYNATRIKYKNAFSDIGVKISNGFVNNSELKLFYDFGNKSCWDDAENRVENSYLNGSDWFKQQTTIEANAAIAPDGTKTATLVTEKDVTGFHFISSAATMTGARTFSAYCKAGTTNRVTLFITQSGNNGARFNLETGQVITVFGAGNTAAIEDCGNGWYRCSVANDGVAASVDNQIRIGTFNGSTNSETPGSPLRSIYVWGPQVERRLESPPFAGRYLPRYSITKTRESIIRDLSGNSTDCGKSGGVANLVTNKGNYLSFDGVDDNLFAVNLTLTPTNGWCIELWLKVDDPTNDNVSGTWNYFWRDALTTGSPAFESGMYSNGSAFSFKDNDSSGTSVQFTMTAGTWHYIAFGITGTGVTYMRHSDSLGQTITETNSGVSAVSGDCKIERFMSQQFGGQCLKGHLGQIRVYNRELVFPECQLNFLRDKDKYGL